MARTHHPSWPRARVAGFSWLLWAGLVVLDAKLSAIVLDLTPCHPLLGNMPAHGTVAPLAEPLLAAAGTPGGEGKPSPLAKALDSAR